MVTPAARREAVGWLQTRGASQRRACQLMGLSRATWQYQRRDDPVNSALLHRLQVHAAERPRFGYRRLHILIAREGVCVNHKRLYRVSRRRSPGAPPASEADHARGTRAVACGDPSR